MAVIRVQDFDLTEPIAFLSFLLFLRKISVDGREAMKADAEEAPVIFKNMDASFRDWRADSPPREAEQETSDTDDCFYSDESY